MAPVDRPVEINSYDQGKLCWRRIRLALLFAPLLAPFYAAILFGHPRTLPIGLILSYPSAFLIGVPALALLARKRRVGCWQCITIGMLCSLPAVIAYGCFEPPLEIEAFSVTNAIVLMAWGAFSGFCFWLLGITGDSPVTWRTIMTAGMD